MPMVTPSRLPNIVSYYTVALNTTAQIFLFVSFLGEGMHSSGVRIVLIRILFCMINFACACDDDG